MDYIKMDETHVEQVSEIEKLCFSAPWSINSIRSELVNPLSEWIVAVDGGVVAGYVGSQTVMGETDMMNIAVHPDYRRRGIGRELVKRLVCCLRQRQSSVLMLEVRESNVAAITLYEQLGFACVGKRPNYYRNPKENALILRKEWSL